MRHTQVVSAVENEHMSEHAAVAPPKRQRALQLAATVTLGAATVAVTGVALVDSVSDGAAQLLLGSLPSRQIVGAATILAFITISYMLCSVSAPSGWLVPVVIARMLSFGAALIAMLWGVLTLPWLVTPLLVDGCESGYVVEERSFLYLSSITVFEKDGLLITPVTHTSADDGHQPFAAGDYGAWVADGRLEGWFALEPGSNARLGRFDLPLIHSPDCRN